MMLISPQKKHHYKAANPQSKGGSTHGNHKRSKSKQSNNSSDDNQYSQIKLGIESQSFHDEANVIERTQSRKIFSEFEADEVMRHVQRSNAQTERYRLNVQKMWEKRDRKGVVEILIKEEAQRKGMQIIVDSEDSSDVKSSLMIDEEIELREGEFSRSQSSIHTLDLVD